MERVYLQAARSNSYSKKATKEQDIKNNLKEGIEKPGATTMNNHEH